MAQAQIGIIGGSGLYKMDALKDIEHNRRGSTRLNYVNGDFAF